MPSNFNKLEQTLFRRLNALVEPAVRKGIGSPRLAPLSLIVLETTGFKSGQQRRTPLWSCRLGRYRIVSTARGDRSFWVKNLAKQPQIRYFLAGKSRPAEAVVVAPGSSSTHIEALPPLLQRLAGSLSRLPLEGWAFAILTPAKA